MVFQAARLGVAGAVVGLGLAGAVRPLVCVAIQDASVNTALVVTTAAMLILVVLLAAVLPRAPSPSEVSDRFAAIGDGCAQLLPINPLMERILIVTL